MPVEIQTESKIVAETELPVEPLYWKSAQKYTHVVVVRMQDGTYATVIQRMSDGSFQKCVDVRTWSVSGQSAEAYALWLTEKVYKPANVQKTPVVVVLGQ